MIFNPGLMTLDNEGFMPSLAALDVIVSTATPAPIVDEQTKAAAAKAAIAAAASAGIPTKSTVSIVDEQTKIAGAKAAVAAAESVGIPTKAVPQAAVPAVVVGATETPTTSATAVTTVTATPIVTTSTTTSAVVTKPDPTKTDYSELTPAQRAAMTQNEKLDYLQAARDAKFEAEAAARGASNPMLNYFVRPAAPQVPGMIQYYSWIGGRTTGEWRLYGAVDNDANRALYGGRVFAGETQASAQSITGANSLKNQPTFNAATGTWTPAAATTATTTTPVTTTPVTTTPVTTTPVTTTPVTTTPVTTTPVTSTLGASFTGSGSTADPFSVGGKPFTGSMFGSTYANGVIVNTAQKTADDIAKQGRLDARTEFGNTLKSLGLPQNLIDEIDTMIKQDYTNSQMYLELQKTQAWKDRFPGMAALSAAGKAIDAGTYISQEKSMLQTLDYYGIDKNIFGTTQELGKQIANLVSPKRFETVVALAAQDVENNPDVLAGLNMYYGVDKSAAISYLLNPTIGLDIIQRQARAAEIGAKAAKSNFAFGMTKEGSGVAESFINAAGTMDLQALDVTFQQARGLSDIQSSIAATEGAAYNDLSAVSAILGKDQAAILDSQRRAARSVARFSGRSGLGSGSLASESSI
jgi:hypothetical protein